MSQPLSIRLPQLGAAEGPQDVAARMRVIPIETLTISDKNFLKGDPAGKPTTIAGALRIARGTGRLPLVISMHGSGGINANFDVWDRLFKAMGISTFAVDCFTGRGIVDTIVDQSQLGRLNMILDLYRSLAVLAAHPAVDPQRIAVIGFSRGGQAALYSSMKRFHKMWNPTGIDLAAYIAFYPSCVTTFIGDTEVSAHPIRIFHGALDDYNRVGPCREYVARLKRDAKDAEITEYPDAWHGFDYPLLPTTPTALPNAQTRHSLFKEEPLGVVVNAEPQKPESRADPGTGRDPHLAYSATATRAAETAVMALLRKTFGLN